MIEYARRVTRVWETMHTGFWCGGNSWKM